MKKFLWAFYILILLCGEQSRAGIARARWLTPNELIMKLPHGLAVDSVGTKFFLSTGESVSDNVYFQLPLLSTQGAYVHLGSGQISRGDIDTLIRGSLKLLITDSSNNIIDSTQVQLAGILDELYYYSGDDLGATCDRSLCRLKIWSPTAQNVQVVFENGETFSTQRETAGTWALRLPLNYKNRFFRYEIRIYQPTTQRFETVQVTDPYSRALSVNGNFSQLVDLDSPEAKPPHWDGMIKPVLSGLMDSVIYELHIRDFSVQDFSISPSLRGTYLAFTQHQHYVACTILR